MFYALSKALIRVWDVLSGVAEMAWDVLSGAAKMAWDVLSGVTKTAWDVLSGLANHCGMFCPGWKKMAWDVLSRDVLSYIPDCIDSQIIRRVSFFLQVYIHANDPELRTLPLSHAPQYRFVFVC